MPDAATIYTGDILFIGGTPIVWAGPLANWIAACDLMLGMDVDTVVPGHGPVTDKAGVTTVRDYLAFVDREATERHAAGVDAFDAARDIGRMIRAREDFGQLGEFGRIAVNVDAVYRSLDPDHQQRRRGRAVPPHGASWNRASSRQRSRDGGWRRIAAPRAPNRRRRTRRR